MKFNVARLRSNFMLLIVSLSLVVGSQAWAETSTLNNEKAKLVSKLAKHVSWPAEARQSKFIIGVYENVGKYEYFSDFFANKGVNGKDILVRFVKTSDEAKNVNILYISSSNKKKSSKLVNRIKGSHALIITEDNKYIPESMIHISYDKKESKITFEVYNSTIVNKKLIMPELSYFVDEKNNKEVLSISPTLALKNEKTKQLILQNKIAEQKASLDQLNEKLNVGKENLEKYNFVLEKHSARLKTMQQENTKKNQEIKAKDKKLQRLEKQFQAQKTQLSIKVETEEQNFQITDKNKTEEQEKTVEELTEKLKEQTKKLGQQKKITNNTVIKLNGMAKDNKALSSFKMLFYVFISIAITALLIAYAMWKKAKNSALQPLLQSKNELNPLLSVRENQLIKSENFAALGYIASDITYAVALSLDDLQAQFKSTGETENATLLKPAVTLLENFNLIAVDQDDTKIQNFDVIAYAQKMMMLYDFEFSQSDILYNYSGEKELTIKSVPSYIALALLNIINNSLKHGFNNNGKGKIALKVEKGTKSGVKITYSDDGKGMSKSTLEQVFKPFFTTHSDRGYVGVGMSTTYDLIKNKLAGDITIESQEGKGTTVVITLP